MCEWKGQKNIMSQNARLSSFATLTSTYWYSCILTKNVYTPITELCSFFAWLVRKNDKNKWFGHRLQTNIIIILCKLQRIFPLTFFRVMVHFVVHLPYETKIVGPVSYSWMYPNERILCTLKQFVRNKACPEESTAEAYMLN